MNWNGLVILISLTVGLITTWYRFLFYVIWVRIAFVLNCCRPLFRGLIVVGTSSPNHSVSLAIYILFSSTLCVVLIDMCKGITVLASIGCLRLWKHGSSEWCWTSIQWWKKDTALLLFILPFTVLAKGRSISYFGMVVALLQFTNVVWLIPLRFHFKTISIKNIIGNSWRVSA